MSKKMNEIEIKKALDITDWRFASKEKIINFVNMLPKIDKEVAINIIKQFPNFADLSKEMVGGLLQQCNNALEKAKEGKDEVIEYYKDILESYKKDLESGIFPVPGLDLQAGLRGPRDPRRPRSRPSWGAVPHP